jgi:hypothetical protein
MRRLCACADYVTNVMGISLASIPSLPAPLNPQRRLSLAQITAHLSATSIIHPHHLWDIFPRPRYSADINKRITNIIFVLNFFENANGPTIHLEIQNTETNQPVLSGSPPSCLRFRYRVRPLYAPVPQFSLDLLSS